MKNHAISIEANPSKGILICLVAYFFYAMIGVCEKAISHNISIPVILFFQSFVCLMMLTPRLIKSNINIFKTDQPAMYALRIGSGIGCYAALFCIIRFMPISEALIYQYAGSIWVPFIMLIWFGVRITKSILFAIVMGFAGILLILKPHADLFGAIAFLGILCGILQAFSVIAIRRLSISDPYLRILFYYFFVGTLITTPLLIKNWAPLSAHDFIFLCGVGVSTYIAQKLITISMQYANATTLAPISYTSILFSGIMGWMFWHEIPGLVTFLGMLLIIAGCILPMLINWPGKQIVVDELEPEAS